jgi:hypothetical protein
VWPSLGEPSQGFLGVQRASLPKGADEWAQSPLPLELWGAPCPGVSCPLRDPTEGVADNASWPLNEQTVQYLYAYQA